MEVCLTDEEDGNLPHLHTPFAAFGSSKNSPVSE